MTFNLNAPFDAHLHLRDEEMLKTVAPETARHFSGAMVMPNLIPPVKTVEGVIAYRERILAATGDFIFKPYMTFFITKDHSISDLEMLKPHILAAKLYPGGVTTNSEGGISSLLDPALTPLFDALADLNIPLSIHGETHDFVMTREEAFAPIYRQLAVNHPKLKIIMEHISTAALTYLLDQFENLFASVTYHHLRFTLDDVIGGMLNPHLFCKPIIKLPEDRKALQNLVFSGHPKVMFGSDSAPHPLSKKLSPQGAAGIFSAPVLLSGLATLFEENDALDKLPGFLHDHAARIYDLTLPEKSLCLEKNPWQVPRQYGDVVPLHAGEILPWQVNTIG